MNRKALRLLIFLFVAVLMCSVTACGKGKQDQQTSESDKKTEISYTDEESYEEAGGADNQETVGTKEDTVDGTQGESAVEEDAEDTSEDTTEVTE